MTTRHAIELDIIILPTICILAGILLAMYTSSPHTPPPPKRSSFSLPVLANFPLPTSLPIETVTPSLPPLPPVKTFSQLSPDGTKKLTMMVTTQRDTRKTYSITTSSDTNNTPQLIYTTTLADTENMTIPFNTWSPDTTYVFLEETTASGSGALVMRANGQPITADEQTLNARALFAARNTGNSYQETTGWASETLLIINTTLPTGGKGPSYWLEVPTKAVIQLSTEF